MLIKQTIHFLNLKNEFDCYEQHLIEDSFNITLIIIIQLLKNVKSLELTHSFCFFKDCTNNTEVKYYYI